MYSPPGVIPARLRVDLIAKGMSPREASIYVVAAHFRNHRHGSIARWIEIGKAAFADQLPKIKHKHRDDAASDVSAERVGP